MGWGVFIESGKIVIRHIQTLEVMGRQSTTNNRRLCDRALPPLELVNSPVPKEHLWLDLVLGENASVEL